MIAWVVFVFYQPSNNNLDFCNLNTFLFWRNEECCCLNLGKVPATDEIRLGHLNWPNKFVFDPKNSFWKLNIDIKIYIKAHIFGTFLLLALVEGLQPFSFLQDHELKNCVMDIQTMHNYIP